MKQVERSIVDVSNSEELQRFIRCISEANTGTELLLLVDSLPTVNNKVGRGDAYIRIIKALKLPSIAYLPQDFKTAKSRLNKEENKALDEAIKKLTMRTTPPAGTATAAAADNSYSSDSLAPNKFTLVKSAVLLPFNQMLATTVLNAPSTAYHEHSHVNKMALFAHLRTDPAAESLWIDIHTAVPSPDTPAFLETTLGPKQTKLVLYDRLVSFANTRKGEYRNYFPRGHMCDEAAAAIQLIDPSCGQIKSGEELKEIETTIINGHDELTRRFDVSGKNRAINTAERRDEIYHAFVGKYLYTYNN
jgi:hypothetical protein